MRTRAAAGVLLLLAEAALAAGPKPLFGPGRHWVDAVSGGFARFVAAASVGVDANFDGVTDLRVDMTGTTEVFRSGALEGDPNGDPGHRNHLDLEIFAMTLTGTIPGLGPATIRIGDGVPNLAADGPRYSRGTSDEVPGKPRLAADLFRIFFELEAAGMTLHNEAPLLVEATIDRLPPLGTLFVSTGPPVPLLTSEGVAIMQVTEATDQALPFPAAACDPGGADAEAVAAARAAAAERCGCGRSRRQHRCLARLLRARVGGGYLNDRCRAPVRQELRATCRAARG